VPELPEVEVVRRDLDAVISGRTIESVEVTGRRTVRRQSPDEFTARLAGARLGPTRRIGKFLLVELDAADTVLVVHLRMSGQLRLTSADEPGLPHTHVTVGLDDGHQLRFVDPRTFGELFVAPAGRDGGIPPALAHLGPDALDGPWSAADLAETARGRRLPIKNLLTDQRRVAGLGNIYSDEALWLAGVRYDRPAGDLSGAEIDRIWEAVSEVLRDAIAHRGSSLADGGYVDLMGRFGGYQLRHRVYGQAGAGCPRCRDALVVRHRFSGRSTFFCPACQP
jgi:formamidopyrimidine-DNA glycosylase